MFPTHFVPSHVCLSALPSSDSLQVLFSRFTSSNSRFPHLENGHFVVNGSWSVSGEEQRKSTFLGKTRFMVNGRVEFSGCSYFLSLERLEIHVFSRVHATL